MTGGNPEAGAQPPLLELRGISQAVSRASRRSTTCRSTIRAGEVHMLLGENGAGKSTLMKVLCGAYRPTPASSSTSGEPVAIASPADARALRHRGDLPGILARSLPRHRAEHLSRPRVPGPHSRALIDRGADACARQRSVLDTIGLDIDPRAPVHTLGVAQQQMVEIAKALSQDARILVMDEPTAALSDRETERLFAMIAPAASAGRRDRLHLAPPGGGVRARRPHHGAARRTQGRVADAQARRRRTSWCS